MKRCALALLLTTCAAPPAPDPAVDPPPAAPIAIDPPVRDTPWRREPPRDHVPADPPAIREWLQTFAYRVWPPQTPIRATGEHGGERLWFNPILAASMQAGNKVHPPGSAAVRELYAGDLHTLKGFALMHKTGTSGELGEAWYWYEIFGTTAAAEPTVATTAAPGCVGCHSHADDFVHSPDTPRDDPQPLL